MEFIFYLFLVFFFGEVGVKVFWNDSVRKFLGDFFVDGDLEDRIFLGFIVGVGRVEMDKNMCFFYFLVSFFRFSVCFFLGFVYIFYYWDLFYL